MAEYKEQRASYPLAPANGFPRSDTESGYEEDSRELRRKKRIKYLLYFIAFVIFQTGVIVIFTLTIMKVRTPKFRVESAAFSAFNVGTQSAPSFNFSMNAHVSIKNANFGRYKYDSTTMYFYYGENKVGQATINKSSVGWRSNKKFDVAVDLSSASVPGNNQLGADLGTGVLPLTSTAELNGKVALTFIFKKKKSAQMNCTMEVSITYRQLSNIVCK